MNAPLLLKSLLGSALLASFAVSASRGQDSSPPVVGEVEAVASPSPLSASHADGTGAYNQPVWVQHRRFSTTRVHIQRNPWEAAVEQWWRGRLKDGEWKHLFQEELEIGLPGRMQFDIYEDWVVEDGKASHKDVAAEIRYGLADWGVIPLNPALYLEYKWVDPSHGADVIEPKLLLGDNFGDYQWGLNFVYERELGGENTEEIQITQGISKAVSDSWSLGLEMKYVHETVEGSRGNPEHKVLLGPSVQWRPTENTHFDVVALAGLTKDAPDIEGYVIFGIDFGGASGGKKVHAPISGRR